MTRRRRDSVWSGVAAAGAFWSAVALLGGGCVPSGWPWPGDDWDGVDCPGSGRCGGDEVCCLPSASCDVPSCVQASECPLDFAASTYSTMCDGPEDCAAGNCGAYPLTLVSLAGACTRYATECNGGACSASTIASGAPSGEFCRQEADCPAGLRCCACPAGAFDVDAPFSICADACAVDVSGKACTPI